MKVEDLLFSAPFDLKFNKFHLIPAFNATKLSLVALNAGNEMKFTICASTLLAR